VYESNSLKGEPVTLIKAPLPPDNTIMYSPEVQTIARFEQNVTRTVDKFFESTNTRISKVKVTTMTLTSPTQGPFDLPVVRDYFASHGNQVPIINDIGLVAKKRCREHVDIVSLRDTRFQNQVTVDYMDSHSIKSIKLFSNGAVQIAGSNDMWSCKIIMKKLSALLKHVFKNPDAFDFSTYKIAMINTNFALNFSVNLYNIVNVFSEAGYDTTFNPDRYSAVKVTMTPEGGDKSVTVSIFSTGKIIMTGAQKIDDIAKVYDTIVSHVASNYGDIFCTITETPEYFDIYRGRTRDEMTKYIISQIGIV